MPTSFKARMELQERTLAAAANLRSHIPVVTGMQPIWGRNGLERGAIANSYLALCALQIDGAFSKNEWTGRIEVSDKFAYTISGKRYSQIDGGIDMDAEINRLRAEIEALLQFTPTPQAVKSAIELIAAAHTFNPVKDYFNALPEWDGVDRANHLASYFGVDDTPLANAILRLIPDGVFLRGTSDFPIKMDYCPMLYAQDGGEGKTRALETFAIKPEWYREGAELDGFDAKRKLQERCSGALIVEFGEIGGLSRREWAAFKVILSSTHFNSRLAYQRTPTTAIIQTVFAGTTNEKNMLLDNANRRFPVISVGSVSLSELKLDLPQIYAQVKAETPNNANEVALPPNLWQAAKEQSDEHRLITEFEPWADDYLSAYDEVRAIDLDNEWRAAGGRISNQGKAAVMQKLGWVSARLKRDGKRTNLWVRVD